MTMPRRRKLGLKWLVLALALAAMFYGYRVYSRRARAPIYPRNSFFEVKRGDMVISILENGALRALNETLVRSGLEGLNRIIHLVPEGAHVKKGDLLVELDSSGLKDRLNEVELDHQDRLLQMLQAESDVKIHQSMAESEIKEAELKIENAASDLEKYRDGDAPLLIKTVEARSSVLAEQVRIATERYARTQELFKTGNATKSELEADALSLKREQLGLGQYQEDLRLIKKFDQPNQVRLLESKVEQAKAELEQVKQRSSNEVEQAEADLKTSRRSVATVEEAIKTQKRRLEYTKIFAPQDGLVVYAPVSPFQMMGGNDTPQEGRFRGGRRGGGGGWGRGGGDPGEYRGSGRRGGRSGSQASSSSSSSFSSGAPSAAAANQRGGSGGGSSAMAGGGNNPSEGGGSGGGSGGSANASSAFVAYQSMRASSTISKTAAIAESSSGSSSSSTSGQTSSLGTPQFGFRSGSQNYFPLPFESGWGTPGVLEEGIMVRQRQELIRLPDVSKMVAEIKIHESRVRQVRVGMTAYIRVENLPERTFKGTVRHVALLPDSQMSWLQPDLKVFPTDVLIEEALPELKPGVSARVEVVITNLTKVLSVPIQTVARLRGENVCFVKHGAGVTPVPVTTGWFNDRFVEVTSGLKEGDQVLLAPLGDEAIDLSEEADTNDVQTAPEPTAPSAQTPAEEPLKEERRAPRRNQDSSEGNAAGGGARPRQRQPNSPEAPR